MGGSYAHIPLWQEIIRQKMGFFKKILVTALTFITAVIITGTLFGLSGGFIKDILKKNYITQFIVGRGPVIGYDANGIPLYEEISLRGLAVYFGLMILIMILTYIFFRIMTKKKK